MSPIIVIRSNHASQCSGKGAAKLVSAGLFLRPLQSQAKALTQLTNPRLGNAVYFASDLMQLAPTLQPANPNQIPALPLGSRIN